MNHIITYNINIKSKRDYLLTVRWTQSEWRDKCWEQVIHTQNVGGVTHCTGVDLDKHGITVSCSN